MPLSSGKTTSLAINCDSKSATIKIQGAVFGRWKDDQCNSDIFMKPEFLPPALFGGRCQADSTMLEKAKSSCTGKSQCVVSTKVDICFQESFVPSSLFRVYMWIVQRQENSSEYVILAVIKKHVGHNGPTGQNAQKNVMVVFKQGNEFVLEPVKDPLAKVNYSKIGL